MMTTFSSVKHSCCSNCSKQCQCISCESTEPIMALQVQTVPQLELRKSQCLISKGQRDTINLLMIEYKMKLASDGYCSNGIECVKMATGRNAAKRNAQNLNNSSTSSPMKATKSKILKHTHDQNQKEELEMKEDVQLKDIFDMMKTMMTRLDKLDLIETKVNSVEQDV